LEFQVTADTESQGVQDVGTKFEAESRVDDTAEYFPENCRGFSLPKEPSGAAAHPINDLSEPRDLKQEALDQRMLPRKRVIVKQKKCQFQWLDSSLRVTIKTLAIRNTKILSHRRVEVSVRFQPSPTILSRHGISMLFSTGPDHQGYHAICPSIRVFRLIPNDSPSAQAVAVCTGDIPTLQVLFAKGEARPSDQFPGGRTLLHVSLTQALTFPALAEITKLVYLGCSFPP
jgi:hypothetical protein